MFAKFHVTVLVMALLLSPLLASAQAVLVMSGHIQGGTSDSTLGNVSELSSVTNESLAAAEHAPVSAAQTLNHDTVHMVSTMTCHEQSETVVTTTDGTGGKNAMHDHSSGQSHECCDEPCRCGHNGCHFSMMLTGGEGDVFALSSSPVAFATSLYLSPSLGALNPPPIV